MEIKAGNFRFTFPYPLVLLLLAIAALWQFAFLKNGLQWDIQDAMLPWRYFAGENLKNGMFPLWNPYQQFGYPFYADLQYTNWNPEVWIIGNLGGYTLYTLFFLIIFYVWMAGYGMYRLALFFNGNKQISFFVACCYMLSGCMISHLQQFVVIIGLAWIPFVCWQFFEFIENLKWKNAVGFSVFFYLLMVSGYQALAFMLVHFFLAVIVYKLFLWRKEKKKIISFLIKGSVVALFCGVLVAPVIIATMQSADYVGRLKSGVSLGEAQLSPFSPQSLVSLLSPAISAKAGWLSTDFTCTNIFFGFIAFFLFIFSLFQKKNVLQKIILGFIFIFLLASFGNYTPVRKILFDFVPLMNLFRIPGLFRIVVLLLILMFISISLPAIQELKRKMKLIFSVSVCLYGGLSVFSYVLAKKSGFAFSNNETDVFTAVHSASVWELVFYQSVFFSFISIIGLIFKTGNNDVLRWRVISVVSVFSLIAGVQFNIYINAAAESDPAALCNWIKEQPKGFPLPANSGIAKCESYIEKNYRVYRNVGNFVKQAQKNDFSSFRFNAADRLADSFPEIQNQLYNYPIAYLSDSVVTKEKYKNFKLDTEFETDSFRDKEYGWFSFPKEKRMLSFFDNGISPEKKSGLKKNESDSVTCSKFFPNEMEFSVSNKNKVIFNLQQSEFKGWKITDNGNPVTEIYKNAGLCMSFI
ncbi:MAG: hypothetical protein IAF38_01610, partial [Bacteroidia bacterium]|nr:hypothetical protein [Bacteroidia bacterium]